MPTYGFAIDLRKCIGCHACTIACKAEHDIPIGVNRCWVKTVEKGVFPEVRRFFFPVLCNQCTDAPCVRICPTNALFKRRDGIVDLYSDSCIGCRACMEACPYDQLFIDPNTRTAEKCNFCANRVENRLLPACVSVCPTECRIFGDLDDPASEVSRIYQREAFMVRKPEKGTGPKVLYLGAEESVIRPEISARPLIYKEGQVHLRPLGAPAEDPAAPGLPRVDYDVPHEKPWGFDMAIYLLTKGIATGALFLSASLWWLGWRDAITTVVGPAIAVVFGIADRDRSRGRPRTSRALLLHSHPSELAILDGLGRLLSDRPRRHRHVVAAGRLAARRRAHRWLVVPAIVASILATSYTGFLFAQGLARDLWQGPLRGSRSSRPGSGEPARRPSHRHPIRLRRRSPGRRCFLVRGPRRVRRRASLLFLAFETLLSPSPSVHHELAVEHDSAWRVRAALLGTRGRGRRTRSARAAARNPVAPWRPRRPPQPVLALAGGFAWEYIWVEAGQSVPLS